MGTFAMFWGTDGGTNLDALAECSRCEKKKKTSSGGKLGERGGQNDAAKGKEGG